MNGVTPGRNPTCPKCGKWYDPGATHESPEDIEKVRRLAFREGREAGAKDMRDRIAAYLQKQGVEHPALPMTVGERLESEHNWDARVRKDN